MDGLPQQDPAATTLVPLTRIEAQALTDRIRETADRRCVSALESVH